MNAALALGLALCLQDRVFPIPQTPTVSGPEHVAVADFDRDGRLDVAVAQAGSIGFVPAQVSVAVHLGTGTGLFGPPLSLAAGVGALTSLAAADLDFDGDVDLCTTLAWSSPPKVGRLSVWLGDGAGAFGPRADYSIGFPTVALALADLDLDGRLDAVTGNLDSATSGMSVLLGRPGGAFHAPAFYELDPTPRALAAGDLNGDGLPDVAAVRGLFGAPDEFDLLVTRFGTGGGALGPAAEVDGGANARSLVLADVDGDGDVDATTLSSGGTTAGEVQILRNDGAGEFPAMDVHFYSGNAGGHAVVDLDGDGVLDVIAASPSASSVDVFLGPVAPGFGDPMRYPAGTDARRIALGDVNGDGVVDAVVTLTAPGSFAALIGLGAGTFSTIPVLLTGVEAHRLAFGDLNGDGLPDAASSYFGQEEVVLLDGGVSVFLGARGVPFLPRVDYPAPTSGPSGIALGDLTGDGVLDVAVSNLSTHQVLVYVGDGAGGLSAPTPFSTGAASMAIAVADLDGDGRLDAVTANSSAGTLSFLAGDGGGGLAAPTPLAAGAGASSVTVGDLDDDGRPDLLCANSTANTISVLLRNPGGGFLPKVDYATPAQPMSIALGDGNGDGRLDALVACAGTALVSHRFGLGGGALGVATDFTMAANAASALYVDLDGDGLHDLASSTISGDALSIRSGDGSGGFGVRRDYTAATLGASSLGGSAGVATADWDADGRLDVGIATRHFFTPIGNLTQPAPSTAAFGVGTPGCAGTLGVAAGGSPTIGGPFRLLSTQAPPDSLGLGLLSFGPDFAGTDLLGIGLVLHVDLAGPALLALDATTDPAGVGVMAFTIPPVPLLAGLTAYFQAIYVLPSCPAIPFGLMSTRGLAITYQS